MRKARIVPVLKRCWERMQPSLCFSRPGENSLVPERREPGQAVCLSHGVRDAPYPGEPAIETCGGTRSKVREHTPML